MLVKCLNLQYSTISNSFVTTALQTAGQIKLDGNLIPFALVNWLELIRLPNRLFLALVITSFFSMLQLEDAQSW